MLTVNRAKRLQTQVIISIEVEGIKEPEEEKKLSAASPEVKILKKLVSCSSAHKKTGV